MTYQYTDTAGQKISITECTDIHGGAHVHVLGQNYRPVTICIPADERQAAAQALAGDEFEVIDKGTYDNLIAESIDAAQAAQPDRPEPVDPWDVATGDVVDYERLPSFKTCRVIGEVQETFSDQDTSWSLRIHGTWWNASPDVATVRVLPRAEPEPDPAAVEHLAGLLHDNHPGGPLKFPDGWREYARELLRSESFRQGYEGRADD